MSFHKDTKGLIEEAVRKEYENATAVDEKLHKGRYYNTLNEGYGVLAEEVLEAKIEASQVLKNSEHKFLLHLIQVGNNRQLSSELESCINYAKNAMCELAQVAAVCKKMIDTINDCYKGGNE